MITVTEGAKEHLKNIAIDNSKTPKLGVRGGGCAGFSYDWGLVSDDEVLKDDETIYFEGGKLVLDGASIMFLFGSTIDLKKNVFGTVLEITTPAAQSSCGCGESINFDMDQVEANSASFQLPK
jgi:iron-sulfur cluster assembly protein